MNVLKTVIAAFSMFSALPVPNVPWDEKNMRYMFCAFPLVGVITGAACAAWYFVSGALGFQTLLYGAGMALLPAAITGGIHLDGFCDTSDALASHAAPEKKREILKDSHAGAFAVISLCSYLILYFALCCEAPRTVRFALLIALTHVMSREMSGLSAFLFRGSAEKGLLNYFRGSADKMRSVIIITAELVITAAAMIVFCGIAGAAAIAAGLISMAYLKYMSAKQFGGMSGDLAGWFLQICELVSLFAAVLVRNV